MIIVGCDVDDTILSLIPRWIKAYNREFGDNLKPKDITDWDIARFVLPEAKEEIFKYIEAEDIFENAKPIEGALKGINYLKSLGYRLIYISANNPFNVKQKWLKKHRFMDNDKDFIQAYDKSLISIDYLIDDKPENITNTQGIGILYSQPHNQSFEWKYRANNWEEVINIIERLEENK